MHIHTLGMLYTHNSTTPKTRRIRPAFTLVELLVVIGIIGILIGLLLPALGRALERARITTTLGTMEQFSKACDAYYAEFGEYPGIIPEDALEAGMSGADSTAPEISGMENALLALMGGYRLPTDSDYTTFAGTVITFNTVPAFSIKVNKSSMGEGPWKNGKHYDAFFSPKGREFGEAKGQMSGSSLEATGLLPELLDAWGQPILYVRQSRTLGPLVGTRLTPAGQSGQFSRAGILPYTLSTGLGDLGADQTMTSNPASYSILNTSTVNGGTGTRARDLTLGQLIRHPAQTTTQTGAADAAKVDAGSSRGKYILISAGPDGIYFSAIQGKAVPPTPQGDIVGNTPNPDGPKVVELFDDLLLPGGS